MAKVNERGVDRDEAEDWIGRAAKIDQEAADKLSTSEVIEAAKGVGVSEAAVHAAERERERLDLTRSSRRKKAISAVLIVAGLGLCAFLAFQAIGALVRSKLALRWELVQRRHADVRSALQRQAFVRDYWHDRRLMSCEWMVDPPSGRDADRTTLAAQCAQEQRDRDVEIAGAANRVTVATRRYDVDVAGYNRYVQSVTWEPIRDFPRHAPYSSEVSQW